MDLDGRKFNREREALQRMQEFQHPFVTRFVSEHRDDQYRFLAMPYVGGLGDLFALLMKAGPRLPQARVHIPILRHPPTQGAPPRPLTPPPARALLARRTCASTRAS